MKKYPNLGARLMDKIVALPAPEGLNPALGPCWCYTGTIVDSGYGRFCVRIGGVPYSFWVHRVAYELLKGEKIPDNMTIDHLCRVRHCIAPKHLEAVSNVENVKRAYIRRSAAYDRLAEKLQLQLI